MSEDFLYQLFNEETGPSAYGMSYYGKLVECARKVHLDAAQKAQREMDGIAPTVRAQSLKVVGTERGTAFHKLQEALARQQLTPYVAMDARPGVYSVSQIAALAAFRAWRARWYTPETKYGAKLVEVEYGLGDRPEEQEEIIARIGGPLTGRADQVLDFSMDSCAKTFANTGLLLHEAGIYIIDWKSTSMSSGGEKFMTGLQAKAYLWLWNLRHPDRPAKGIIFDRIILTKDVKFDHFLVLPGADDEKILARYVQHAIYMRDSDVPNADACTNWMTGKTCWWIDKGCTRF